MFFDRNEDVAHLSGNLPHWKQYDVIYFVTFRLYDSLPQDKLKEWKQEKDKWNSIHCKPLSLEEKKEYHRLFTARMNKWFDNNYGSCVLKLADVKRLVENALGKFHNVRYSLDEYIIMPNHVHVLVQPFEKYSLSDIVHSWKSFTAHEILKINEARYILEKFKINAEDSKT